MDPEPIFKILLYDSVAVMPPKLSPKSSGHAHFSQNERRIAAFLVASTLMLSFQSVIGFQSSSSIGQQAYAQSASNLAESKDIITRSFTYPILRFNGEVVAEITQTMTWYPNGTTLVSDDRGQEFAMHIPLDMANFTLLSNENTVVQRVVGDEYQYDVYWAPFENEDRIVDKYKFTIIGSSKSGLDIKFALDTDKEVVSDGNKFIVTEKIAKTDSVNSTAGILSNVTNAANSTALLNGLSNGTSGAPAAGLGLDWSDAKTAGYDMKFDPETLELSVNVGEEFSVDPTTVATISDLVSPQTFDYYEGERRIVEIDDVIFVFFYDGSNVVYKTSTDNGNSFNPGVASAGTGVISSDLDRWTIASTTSGGLPRISLLYFTPAGSSTDFYAKRGTVNGTEISWDAATFLFSANNFDSVGVHAAAVAATDSQGDVYAALRWIPSTATYHYRIMNSSDGGLSWDTSLDTVNTGEGHRITMALTDLDSEKMLFAFATFSGSDFRYRVLSGTWGSEQSTPSAGFTGSFTKKLSSDSNSTNSAYLAYVTSGPGALKVAIWDSTGGFQGFETANSTASHSLPSITITPDDLVRIFTVSDSKIVNTTKSDSTWQATEFSFGTTFDSPDQLTSAILHPSALWVESGNNLRFGTAMFGDFEVTSVVPVQAIFNHDKLVDQKSTVLRLDVDSTFGVTLSNVKIRITFGSPESGNTTLNQFASIAPGANVLYLPNNTVIFPTGSNFSASAQIDPDDTISELDETNNIQHSSILPIKDTLAPFVLYRPVQVSNDDFPDCPTTQLFAASNTEYLTATYPVSEQESGALAFCPPFQPVNLFGFFGSLTLLDQIELQLDSLTWFSSPYDKVIGVVGSTFFEDHFSDPSVNAAADPNLNVVIVEEQLVAGPTVAHELAHTYGWVDSSSLQEDPDHDGHIILMKAPGYWVGKRCEMGWYNTTSNMCIAESEMNLTMTNFAPYELMFFTTGNAFSAKDNNTADSWVSNHTYNFLLDQLNVNPEDPTVIGVRGIIFENDTSILSPWYTFNSTLDIPLDNPGDFTIAYQNALNQTIAETGFDLDFDGFEAAGDPDSALLSLRIPDVSGTSKIVISRENETLGEREVTVVDPVVNVTGPNGGENFATGQDITVTWESSDIDSTDLSHIVSISLDGGVTWIALAVDLPGNNYTFTATADLISDQILFKVIGTDGINTGEDESDATSTIEGPVSTDYFLHATGPTANPTNLFLNSTAPTSSTTKHKDSASVKFAGGNQWKVIGQWPTDSPPSEGTLTDLGNLTVWLGLKNSDDIGTRFDLRAEIYRDNELVTSGQTHCITGIVRNPANAKEVVVPFDAFAPEEFDGNEDLSVKILTRIGTNPDDTFCGGHSNATGLRLYFDSVSRPSMFNATSA